MARVKNKETLVNKILLNRYQITSWWMDGGLSSIYNLKDLKAKSDDPDEDLIVKVIQLDEKSKSELDKALDELSVFKNFAYNNDNIIHVIDYGFIGNNFFLIMKRAKGESLEQLIARKVVFTTKEALYIIKQIVNGLKFLHTSQNQKPMIHRDIKPQNIMIDDQLKVTIIDFGISTIFDESKPLTQEKDLFCSPQYSSTDILALERSIRSKLDGENLRAYNSFKKIVTPQLDIHPVGLIFYILLTNQFPNSILADKNMSDKTRISSWLTYDVPVLSLTNKTIPSSIDNIIFRCTASKSEYLQYRYQSVTELEKDLLTCLEKDRFNEPLILDLKKRNLDIGVYEKFQFQAPKIAQKWTLSRTTFILIIAFIIIVLIVLFVIAGIYGS